MFNNPLSIIDPTGMDGEGDSTKTSSDAKAKPFVPTNTLASLPFAASTSSTGFGAWIGLGLIVGGMVADLTVLLTSDAAKSSEGEFEEDNEASENEEPIEIFIDGDKHPESAQHAQDAQDSGHPIIGEIDREGKKARRKEALKETDTVPGKDRDEYPPAFLNTGGKGSSVRPISPSDNRGSGASFGNQIRSLQDGTRVRIIIKHPKKL